MAVELLSSGQTGNYTTTLWVGAGKGRYLLVGKGWYNRGFTYVVGTQTFNGLGMTLLADYRSPNDNGERGWAVVWGVAIPDSWGAGNYNIVGSNQRYLGFSIFANVDQGNPFYSSYSNYNIFVKNVFAGGIAMDPGGGGLFMCVGTTGGGPAGSSNMVTCYSEEIMYTGCKVQAGGTLVPVLTSNLPNNKGVASLWSLRAKSSGGSSSVIWW